MSKPQSTSGIRTAADGQAYIPSSKRADGSTRKQIKVRPGYQPPEDVEKYKSRVAESWRSRGGFVPGVDDEKQGEEDAETKSKNAKRREAARKKKEQDDLVMEKTDQSMAKLQLGEEPATSSNDQPAASQELDHQEQEELERQKKIRNVLKKLRAVRELKQKKAAGDKLSAEQLVKVSKEPELVKDLEKLGYDDSESQQP